MQRMACPNIYMNESMDVTAVCDGDDGHELRDEDSLDKLKVRATLGFEPRDDRFATFLNKQVRLSQDTLDLEAEPWHEIDIIRVMCLESGSLQTEIMHQSSDQAACKLEHRPLRLAVCFKALS